ncbi:MAG: ABC transporter substrate-binding protein [Clostridiales bacterium]|nr:ABC transporter substrate-binding protein [Clostridiales bacterium]
MKTKTIKTSICIVLILCLISGCTSNEPIRIGFVGTLTGPSAAVAIDGKRGVELAIDKINAAGGVNGREIVLVVKDSLNDSEIAKKVAAEFYEENIQIVLGDFTSTLTKSALEYINGKNILYLSPTASSNEFDKIDDNLLRFSGTSISISNAILDQMEIKDDKNIILFKDENNKSFVDSFGNVFDIEIKSAGGNLLEQIYFDSKLGIDEKNITDKIQEHIDEVDGVLLLANAPSTVFIVQAIIKSNIDVNIYTSGWSNTDDLLVLGGAYIEGMYTVGTIDTESTSEKYIEFSDKYLEYFGTKPTLPSMFAYDTMMALYEGLLKSNSTNAKDVKASILDIGIVEGLQSTFEIDEYGDSSRAYLKYIIKNGKVVRMAD